QTPVWVTAQALAAVRRKALPVTPAPRRARHTPMRVARVRKPALGHAKPLIERVKPRRPAHTARAPRVVKPRPLAARRVSEVRRGGSDSGGSAILPAMGIAAAGLVAGAVVAALRRRHV